MTTRQAIEARIRTFIQDYADWEQACRVQDAIKDSPPLPCDVVDTASFSSWFKAFQAHKTDDLNLPRAQLEALARRHCVSPDLLTRHGFVTGLQLHDPVLEDISAVHINGDHAEVSTDTTGGNCTGFEYTLKKVGQEWRIARILQFHTTDQEVSTPTWTPTETTPILSNREDAGLDLSAPFKPKAMAFITETQKRERLSVVQLGELLLADGWLTIVDQGDYLDDPVPLELKLPKRSCRVELVRASFHNAFVRIAFGDLAKVSTYVPAHWLSEEPATPPATISTRGGSILIVGAEAWATLSKRSLEKFYLQSNQGYTRAKTEKAGFVQLPGTPHQALLVGRGGGDYTVHPYWALDASEVAQGLIVDLAQCGGNVDHVLHIPAHQKLFESTKTHPQLEEFGLNVRFAQEDDRITIIFKGNSGIQVDLVDKLGRTLTSTRQSCSQSMGDEHYGFLENLPDNLEGLIYKFTWQVWQHAFTRDPGF